MSVTFGRLLTLRIVSRTGLSRHLGCYAKSHACTPGTRFTISVVDFLDRLRHTEWCQIGILCGGRRLDVEIVFVVENDYSLAEASPEGWNE